MDRIIIRRAEKKDIPALGRLLFQVHKVHSDVRPDLFKAGEKKYTEEDLVEILSDEKGRFLQRSGTVSWKATPSASISSRKAPAGQGSERCILMTSAWIRLRGEKRLEPDFMNLFWITPGKTDIIMLRSMCGQIMVRQCVFMRRPA